MAKEQKNKPHKTRFASKSQRNKHKNAKDGSAATRPNIRRALAPAVARAQRLHQAKQVRDQKRFEVLTERREQSKIIPPRILAIVPLCQGLNVGALKKRLLAANDNDAMDSKMVDEADNETQPSCGLLNELAGTIVLPKQHVRLTVVEVPVGNISGCMEMSKVADIFLFVVPAGGEGIPLVDDWGRRCLSILRAQGLPSIVGVIQGLSEVPIKRKTEAKKISTSALHAELGPDCKVLVADRMDDCQQLFRYLGEHKPTVPFWRTQRPYVVAQKLKYVPCEEEEQGPEDKKTGTLLISGYVRSRALSVNQLVHVTGAGDFQLVQIDGAEDPHPLHQRREANDRAVQMEGGNGHGRLTGPLVVADPELQEPLIFENTPDPLAGEQTWPTEDELRAAAAAMKRQVVKRRLPKGTSDYQAEWLAALDDAEFEEEVEEEEGKEEEGTARMGNGRAGGPRVGIICAGGGEGEELEEQDVDMDVGGAHGAEERARSGGGASRPGSEWGGSDDDDGRSAFASEAMEEDEDESVAEREKEKQRLRALLAEDEEYPDEVDTPTDIPARQRFNKYRGLKSFRTTPWDPKESLPVEYARLFAFDNFKRTQKQVLAHALEVDRGVVPGTVEVGTYVTLHVKDVPADVAAQLLVEAKASPVVACGLLQHESKLSVLHFGIKKSDAFTDPVKSKQPLTFHVGFRRFTARPIFSTDDLNMDKHKFERFLHPGRFVIASIYGPVTFPPLPVLIFRGAGLEEGQAPAPLVATGSLRGPDPDRIILKRIILSGYPLRVQKRKAVVRYMFHNCEDVRWFRPAELWTKYGRRGRIKEHVGTHGNMKCIFDGVIQQRDAVCISLYKRVYPKFT